MFNIIATIFTVLNLANTVKGEEDDYPFEHLVVDIGSGIMLSECEKDPNCKDTVGALMLVSIIVFIFLSCCGCIDESCFSQEKISAKRSSGVATGYIISKTLFN